MKIGKNKKLSYKIIITILVALLLFNFTMPTIVKATNDEDEGIGGVLFSPIQALVVGLGDSMMKLMQYAFTGDGTVIIKINEGLSLDDLQNKGLGQILLGALVPGGKVINIVNNYRNNTVYIPNFKISPESIFGGRIPAFDINFFNPGDSTTVDKYDEEVTEKTLFTTNELQSGDITEFNNKIADIINNKKTEYGCNNATESTKNIPSTSGVKYITEWTWKANNAEYKLTKTDTQERAHIVSITLKSIETEKKLVNQEVRKSSALILQSTVSYWYKLLRNIAIIGLLSVLVYVGIRIVLSSTAADKSKYKEMLKDWLVAMCLLFFMHYFMSFVVTVTDSVSRALIKGNTPINSEEVYYVDDNNEDIAYSGDKLIGNVRLKLQKGDLSQQMSFTIIYIVLVIYTFVFAIMYLKRVIYMAFFTMMAPLVALTYPLDKIRDGKAQAFDMWMKEYTFNALIQPFHLIIYTVLVSSAINLATENPIYALVAIGFMIPAEKLLRKFFGFSKSETAGVLGGALGGAMVMQGINALTKRTKGGSGGKAGKGGVDAQKDKINMSGYAPGNDRENLLSGAASQFGSDDSQVADNPSNKIPSGDSEHNASQERLDELTSEGFGPGDEEYDAASREAKKYAGVLNADTENPSNEYESSNYDEDYNNYDDYEDDYDDDDLLHFSDTSSDDTSVNDSEIEPNEEDTSKVEFGKSFRGVLKTAGHYVGPAIPKVAGLAARGVATAALGTIGVAAGLASEDYSNVFKYGAAGIAGGNIIGKKISGKIEGLPSTAYRVKTAANNVRDEYEKNTYDPEEVKRRQHERANNAFMKDKEAIKLYKEKFKDKYMDAMQAATKYRDYGVYDNKTIIRAMKLKTRGLGENLDDERRILIAATAPSLNRKDVDAFGERLQKRGFGKRGSEVMRDAVREFNEFE